MKTINERFSHEYNAESRQRCQSEKAYLVMPISSYLFCKKPTIDLNYVLLSLSVL